MMSCVSTSVKNVWNDLAHYFWQSFTVGRATFHNLPTRWRALPGPVYNHCGPGYRTRVNRSLHHCLLTLLAAAAADAATDAFAAACRPRYRT